ncbi:hypothetical protein WKW77_19960 [Variovorax ureilyticus]|uniref:Uncharacterized protein n=1 Tax=Variovorax ureilyticus TaxID=1836198 RepID=A0ABU8VIE0_9BURK
MGQVIQFRRKAAADDRAPTNEREVLGQITINAYNDGTTIDVTGSLADRLELAQYGMIKGLDFIAKKIAEGGNAGYTASPSFRAWAPLCVLGQDRRKKK